MLLLILINTMLKVLDRNITQIKNKRYMNRKVNFSVFRLYDLILKNTLTTSPKKKTVRINSVKL